MEEQLKTIFANINEWLRFAEAKNGALLAANAATIFGAIQVVLGERELNFWWYLYLYVLIFFIVLSIIITLVSFLPRTKIPWIRQIGEKQKYDNLLFFGDISKYTPSDYIEHVIKLYGKDITPSRLDYIYAEQIVINSRIASKKYEFFRVAMWCTIAGIMTPLLAFIMYLLFKDKQ